jgi:hypothetical protein
MAELSNAIFYGDVSFVIAVFDSTANFALAKYKSRASFREARFDKDALFSVNNFELPIDFSRTVFNSSVFFNNSTFKSSVDFSGAVIQSNADFRWVQFHSSSNCTDARFGGTVDFSDGHFYENATFRWARFGDAVWFRNTILPDTMDFENVRYIEREIDFTNAKRPTNGKNCEIALLGSDIRKIKLNMELFHLWFPDLATFNQLNGKLDTVSVTFDQKRGVYESVLKKLKDDGLIESYKILDIEYQDTLYNRSGWFNRLVINNWQKVWWNYGYDKMRVFYCSFGLLLLFSFVNLPLYRKLASEVYSIDFVEKSVSTDMGRFRRWLLHLRKTTTYTTIIFFGLKMDLEKFRENVLSHHPWLLMYLMFVYLVGLVCLGFIANIILAR